MALEWEHPKGFPFFLLRTSNNVEFIADFNTRYKMNFEYLANYVLLHKMSEIKFENMSKEWKDKNYICEGLRNLSLCSLHTHAPKIIDTVVPIIEILIEFKKMSLLSKRYHIWNLVL